MPFGHGRAGRVQGVLDAALGLLHLGLGGRADLHDRHAANELGEPLGELLLVVLALGLVHLRTDRLHPRLDGLLALGVRLDDDRGVFLIHRHLIGRAQHVERDVLELDAAILADECAAGEHGNVLHHRLAAIAEARSLDGADLEQALAAD